jgi:hypothetical protein
MGGETGFSGNNLTFQCYQASVAIGGGGGDILIGANSAATHPSGRSTSQISAQLDLQESCGLTVRLIFYILAGGR